MIAIEATPKNRCLGCGREYGTGDNGSFGPKCTRKIERRMRAVPRFSEDQLEKSLDLIRDAGFEEVRPGIFRVLSSTMYRGELTLRQYLTNGTSCTCPHGVFGSKGRVCNCYHARTVREVLEVRNGS